MDLSAWSWASHFRLHEAACLIAGVMPISKRNPATEELPSQARPPLIKLAAAYYEWLLQAKNPERPMSIALEGIPNEDGSLPPFPTPKEVSGEIVSREAIHRFVSLMAERGFKSCYDFGPIAKAGPPHEVSHQKQAATPAPVVDTTSTCPTVLNPISVDKRRRNLLTPVIESAVRACDGRTDHAEVFNKLRAWAQEETPRQPLLGVTDKGIKWLGTNDEPKELDMKALQKRLRPRPPRTAKDR
jgi:hypothetical protein